jgi:hypothetical protein
VAVATTFTTNVRFIFVVLENALPLVVSMKFLLLDMVLLAFEALWAVFVAIEPLSVLNIGVYFR